MNNYEKAMNGFVFKQGTETLAAMRLHAKDLCFEYNNTLPSDTEKHKAILDQLISDKKNCTINSPFYCDYGNFITLGDHFFANYNCKILDGGKVAFGNDVLVGPDCTFVTPSHPLDPEQRLNHEEIFLPINVGDNVWFGARVTVLGSVTIGNNCVIASGSVVTRDLPDNTLCMGVPCRPVRLLNEADKTKYPYAD